MPDANGATSRVAPKKTRELKINTHIPGRCDKRLRALLVECAQAVARSKHPSVWVKHILDTKPKKVALIAIANRIARQCWAVASKSEDYRDMSAVPAA